LIALIEYAVIKLPNHSSDGLLSSIANKTIDEAKQLLSARDVLIPRITSVNEASPAITNPITPVTSAATPTNYLPLAGGDSPASPGTSVAAKTNYLPPAGGKGQKLNPNYAKPSDYLPVGSNPTAPPESTADPSAYLPINKNNGGTSQAAPSAYLPIDNGKPSIPAHTADPSAYLPLAGNPKPNAQPNGGGGNVRPQVADPTNYVSVIRGGHDPVVQTLSSGTIDGLGYAVITSSIVVDGHTYATAVPTTATLSNGKILVIDNAGNAMLGNSTTSGTIDGLGYAVITSSIVVDGHTYATAVPTTTTLSNGKILVIDNAGNAMLGNSTIPATRQQSIHALTIHQYLIGGIVPTIVGVLFNIPWLILDAAIKEMEPYYQLKQINGASAVNSLCMNYSSSITAVAAFKSLFNGHYTVFWSSLISMIVLLLAPLSSEAIYIGFIGHCTATSGRQACIPRVSVYPLAARLVQGILSFVAVLTLLLAISIARRKSGVYASPLCIAGTASLMQHPNLLRLLHSLDPDTTDSKKMANQLLGTRFRLGPYVDENGRRGYGIKPSNAYDEPSRTFLGEKYASVHVTSVNEGVHPKYKRPAWKSYFGRIPLSLLAFVAAGMLALIVYYNRTGGDTAFERFMDSQSFGSRFLFTGIGVGIKLYWSSLDNGNPTKSPITITPY
jgi:hypothetical protein